MIEAEPHHAGMLGDLVSRAIAEGKAKLCEDDTLLIDTLEGSMICRPGDWIICGVKGEYYPCRNDIFEQTYEAVS